MTRPWRSRRQLDELLHPDVGVSLLSTRMGHDLTGFPIDGPLPELPQNKVIGSRSDDAIEMARSKNMTIRQLYQWFARQRGHAGFVGTPTEVVDQMEQWFKEDACDGFNFLAPVFPIGLNDFVDMVVPELQRRGLYRTAYEGPTCATSSACRSRKAVTRAVLLCGTRRPPTRNRSHADRFDKRPGCLLKHFRQPTRAGNRCKNTLRRTFTRSGRRTS